MEEAFCNLKLNKGRYQDVVRDMEIIFEITNLIQFRILLLK